MEEFRTLPVYAKSEELIELVRALVASFDESRDAGELGQLMMENAFVISSRIAKAEGADWYSQRLDNATLIKLAAKDLLLQLDLCRGLEITDTTYVELVERDLDIFRLIFLEWVASFDDNNDMIDEWSFYHL